MAFLLVVDDDTTLRDTLVDLFAVGHFCQGAGTAEQALAWLEEDPFDVVLVDISLPGLSGSELLGIIRQRWPNIPVIIISGIRDHEQAQGLIRMGAFDYLLKPFQLEEVEASVYGAIEHRRRLVAAHQRHVPSIQIPKLYILSMYAENAKSGNTESQHAPGVVIAFSEDEAKQLGFEQAHEKWPRGAGWLSHNVTAIEVEREIITKAAKLPKG